MRLAELLWGGLLRPVRLVRRIGGSLAFVVGLVRSRPGPEMTRPARAEVLADAARTFCRVHDLEVVLEGSFPPGPKVVVMNHVGYVDPMVLAAHLPLTAIAKSEVAAWPVVGAVCRALGVMFVVRGNRYSGFRVLREAIRALSDGLSVLNFAEGTTSCGEDVLPFHRGIFGVARITGVPVVPVRLRLEDATLAWVGDDAFLPHYLDFASRERSRVFLDVLAPIDSTAFDRAESLSDATRAALRDRPARREVRVLELHPKPVDPTAAAV